MYLYDDITVGHPSLLVFARLDMYDKIVAVRRGTIYNLLNMIVKFVVSLLRNY